jgi:hypothetical protein
MKQQPTEWDKIFASYSSDKALTRIFKDLKKLKTKELIIQLANRKIDNSQKEK